MFNKIKRFDRIINLKKCSNINYKIDFALKSIVSKYFV